TRNSLNTGSERFPARSVAISTAAYEPGRAFRPFRRPFQRIVFAPAFRRARRSWPTYRPTRRITIRTAAGSDSTNRKVVARRPGLKRRRVIRTLLVTGLTRSPDGGGGVYASLNCERLSNSLSGGRGKKSLLATW